MAAALPLVSSGGAAPSISIAQANGATDGYLSQTDWSNFNNKVPASRTVNGKALSSNITLSKSDIGLANVTNVAGIEASALDTTITLGTDNTKIPSQKAVKSYVDTELGAKVDKTITVNGQPLSSNVIITKSNVGLTNVLNIKDKVDATVPPTVSNDIGEGYAVGSRWYDTTNGKVYTCLDSSVGSALWKLISTFATDGTLDMNAKKITNLATPTATTDAATKAYVDAAGGVRDSVYSMTANDGMYDNRIADMTPPLAYTEVCFKGGSTQYDYHAVSESTAGGNCLPGDVGFIIERDQRTGAMWVAARQNCLNFGMRLPEPFEWQLSCNNRATWNIWSMTNGNYEWASNSAQVIPVDLLRAVVVINFGNTCGRAGTGTIAFSTGDNQGIKTYRCVR